MNSKNLLIGVGLLVLVLLAIWFYNNSSENDLVADDQKPVAEDNSDSSNDASDMPEESAPADTLAGSGWLLESASLTGQTVDMNVNVPQALTLNFDASGKKYTGFAGCNSFGGTYSLETGNKLSFGATTATKKFCVTSSELEGQIFSAMEKVAKFNISGGKLVVQSVDGKTKLTYKEAI